MPEEQPLEISKSKINNLPFVKNETLKIFIWFLAMVIILGLPLFLLRFWFNGCSVERNFQFPPSFGCEGVLFPISLAVFAVQSGITILFGVVSFIKKEANQFLVKLYLISLVIVILTVLIMLGGNFSFFINNNVYE